MSCLHCTNQHKLHTRIPEGSRLNSRERLDLALFRVLLALHTFTPSFRPCFGVFEWLQRSDVPGTCSSLLLWRTTTHHLGPRLTPLLPLLASLAPQVLPYSREVGDTDFGLDEISHFQCQRLELIYKSVQTNMQVYDNTYPSLVGFHRYWILPVHHSRPRSGAGGSARGEGTSLLARRRGVQTRQRRSGG